MKNYNLILRNSAFNWENASPIGLGSAGAMVFGGVDRDKLELNEESIWSGGPKDTRYEGYAEKIRYIRQLFLDDKEEEADAWTTENMGDCFNRIKPYEYAGQVYVRTHGDEDCDNYLRNLSLNDGILTVSYDKDGAHYSREYFASNPASLICAEYTCDKSFGAEITYERENLTSLRYTNDYIVAEGKTAEGDNRFRVCVRIVTDGSVSYDENGVKITDAGRIELYICIVTSFKYDDLCSASAAIMKNAGDYDGLKKAHVADFTALMNRSDIDFPDDPGLEEMSVSDRLERLKNDPEAHDYSLMSLYWQFAKYLLIGSSRVGTLPANLQGVWADGLTPPWNADYHTNINLQMNYWQAEEANIGECTIPLFDYMNNYLLPGGEKVARENYGTGGLVVHHLSDIYGYAAASDGLWGLWPLGGAWLCYHMWEHYLYTEDESFLRDTAYRFIKESAQFFMENMFEGKDGYMHTGPSTSPENRYYKEVNGENKKIFLAMSPTMDIEIVGGLFDMYAQCEDILGIDPENAKKAREIRAKMPPLRVGKRGQLMEWYKDYDEPEPGHRHISHAFGLYPSAQINHSTPELFAAIEKSLDLRLASGGGHTGWSRAWLINLFARLGRGEKAYENVRLLFTRSTAPNLFDIHPPFQIDGNFGGGAGIGEMVMQSHEGYISLFPAVPENISCSFTGLKARGDVTVSAEWKNGVVVCLSLCSPKDKTVTVKLPSGEVKEIALTAGKVYYA